MYICTQITIKATAGLRMLSGDLSNQIISEIRKKLEQYPFPIFEDHGVGIMSGKLEGLFAWITTNYLLGKIGTDNKLDTAGVLDLGGGSTQIVFEPKAEMPPGAHTIKIKFAKHSYTLYQHSYDGYGLIQGRERIKKVSLETNKANCLSPTKQIEIKHQEEAVILKGTSSGLKECQTLIQTELFSKDSCPLQPCAFDGVFMPKISETFITQDIFAFSYFYDKYAEPFLKDEFTIDHLQDAAEKVCSKEEPKLDPKGQKEFGKNNQWCADLSFMYTLLSSGYEIPKDRIIKTVKKINGIEIGWTLGAALQMINSQLTDPAFIHCR
jgi:guanosine-diphosphatase